MKKLFFTAIAVIAFSGVSMAGTSEDPKDVNAKQTKKEVLRATPCQDAAINYYEAVIAQNGGVDDIPLLQSLLNRCK